MFVFVFGQQWHVIDPFCHLLFFFKGETVPFTEEVHSINRPTEQTRQGTLTCESEDEGRRGESHRDEGVFSVCVCVCVCALYLNLC